jgi:hypothetical protein
MNRRELLTGAVAVAALAAPSLAFAQSDTDFLAAAERFRLLAAISPNLAGIRLEPDLEARAWRLFFEGSLTTAAARNGDFAAIGFINPVYDGLVLTSWRWSEGWQLASVSAALGARLRGEAPAAAPGWLSSSSAPMALQQLPPITAESIAALATQARGGADDRQSLLIRIAALRGALDTLFADAAGGPLLRSALAAYGGADISSPFDLNSTERIRALPRHLRDEPVLFGAVHTSRGWVVPFGLSRAPGFVALIGIEAGQPVSFLPVAVRSPAGRS